ncbi:CoA transferase [Bradyrhizobium sp. 190]|uniref:CaiB/BaiF CoA transferase family protein n=1 Tax=Bradyrhizobium sp. 190 TaxID=2782658 RepID=UPI001FF8AB43|nr:CaiB/BaiF CoA-transferase family protein [Bradyrhizobium sp. 190]MCK1513202.1 CoA transferase [Bradyrhizobium sp. 190]
MGPLEGIKVVELAGIGPGPFAATLLADLGATVLRIDRTEPADIGIKRPARYDLLLRNRPRLALDLKQPEAVEQVLRLVDSADVLIEGFRPGVTERMGLGPDVCFARNPRLVYGRITGWGQSGPLAHAAGHDVNYIALTGVLAAIGRKGGAPAIPLALAGDFSGGALYLVIGVLSALLEARQSGRGQVIDAAIVDGTASMAMPFYGQHAGGLWQPERGSNVLDSGAPFYDVYECQDGLWISIGPVEARFYAQLLDRLGMHAAQLGEQYDRANWAAAKVTLAGIFRSRTRQAWCDLLEGTDVCFAPVLSFDEAPRHPHLQARGTFIDIDGVVQPAPAPRFSRSVPDTPKPPQAEPGRDFEAALSAWESVPRFAHGERK